MCRCTPEIRTPWCGKKGCEVPEQKKAVYAFHDDGLTPPTCNCNSCQAARINAGLPPFSGPLLGDAAPELQGRKDLEEYKPKVMRPGTELVAYSPEPVVGLLEFQDSVIVATSGGVWRMVKGEDGKDVFERILFTA
jgi:hypothetical protein